MNNPTSNIALAAGAPAPLPPKALFSPKETQALLSISHSSFYRLANAGRLDVRKIGNKSVVPRESIERFIRELPRF